MIYIIEQGPAVPLPARRSIAGPAVPLPGPAVLFHYILYQSNTYIYIYNLYDLYNRARPGGSIAGPAVHCRPGGPIARPSGSISLYIISIKYIYIYI